MEKRLERLAQRTGRTKTFYVREAILQHPSKTLKISFSEQRVYRCQRNCKRRVSAAEYIGKVDANEVSSFELNPAAHLVSTRARTVKKSSPGVEANHQYYVERNARSIASRILTIIRACSTRSPVAAQKRFETASPGTTVYWPTPADRDPAESSY